MIGPASGSDELIFSLYEKRNGDFGNALAWWYEKIVAMQEGVWRNKSKCHENNRSYLETTQWTGKAKTPGPISN